MEAEKQQLSSFNRQSISHELSNISNWWQSRALDDLNGGFVGEIDFFGKPNHSAEKGCVLNTRILWFFSELAGQSGEAEHLQQAKLSYNWLLENLIDNEYGGLLWSVTPAGEISDGKKQTYAQSFGIYALCSYYHLTGDPNALAIAMSCFGLVEKHARDSISGGYVEACDRHWNPVSDYRLSDKDLNLPKSMNTLLHVLEAYTALFRVSPTPHVEEAFRHVLNVFLEHVVCDKTHHLKLFFEMDWEDKSQTYSFGHDIEASWLLWEAALVLGDTSVIEQVKLVCIKMAEVCATEAIGSKGQVCDDYDFLSGHKDEKSYWWVQAEALVGFMNAYALTSEPRFFELCVRIWEFIQQQHLDSENGEWHWVAKCDQSSTEQIYKAGFWKAPYHNGRAMMELQKLFVQLEANQ